MEDKITTRFLSLVFAMTYVYIQYCLDVCMYVCMYLQGGHVKLVRVTRDLGAVCVGVPVDRCLGSRLLPRL